MHVHKVLVEFPNGKQAIFETEAETREEIGEAVGLHFPKAARWRSATPSKIGASGLARLPKQQVASPSPDYVSGPEVDRGHSLRDTIIILATMICISVVAVIMSLNTASAKRQLLNGSVERRQPISLIRTPSPTATSSYDTRWITLEFQGRLHKDEDWRSNVVHVSYTNQYGDTNSGLARVNEEWTTISTLTVQRGEFGIYQVSVSTQFEWDTTECRILANGTTISEAFDHGGYPHAVCTVGSHDVQGVP